MNLSAYYNRTGDPDKALEHAGKALELDPKSDRAWFQKGRADERQGSLDEAVDALNQAIAFNPRASSYYYVLAGVYRRLAGWTKAGRRWRCSSASSGKPTSSTRSGAAPQSRSSPARPDQKRE